MSTFSPLGVDLFGEPLSQPGRGALAAKFICPPFSILNAREGWWQERKAAWIGLGIRGELGRGANGEPGGSEASKAYKSQDRLAAFQSCRPHGSRDPRPGREPGEYVGGDAWVRSGRAKASGTEENIGNQTGTSIFDPVLCELAYRWFCPPGGIVVDPFAGGSVRGIVAALLGRSYWGCDLRAEQIAANESQAEVLCNGHRPQWIAGDSLVTLESAPQADFIFSCPPYGNLEIYSDDPLDLSNMPAQQFADAYTRIISKACDRLRTNRFACFVVGDYRGPDGNYSGFVSLTIAAFRDAGLSLYNHAILITAVGSLPIRVPPQFNATRKLGKTHQDILVFLKGDSRIAASACATIDDWGDE